jgi:hypothetical protein
VHEFCYDLMQIGSALEMFSEARTVIGILPGRNVFGHVTKGAISH